MGVVLVGRADGGGRRAGGTRKGLGRLRVGVRETFGLEVEAGESIRLGRETEEGCSQVTGLRIGGQGTRNGVGCSGVCVGWKCAEFDVGGRAL